jgi:uncharacterized protein YbbC (DUF1343 family)
MVAGFILALTLLVFGPDSGRVDIKRGVVVVRDSAAQEGLIRVGAAFDSLYLPYLQGKRVGLVVNHTSRVGGRHLLDTLVQKGVNVVRIFAPEHGFRGEADAGQKVASGRDSATGLDVVSLYGKKKGPDSTDMALLDVLVFDIQDVGARFYTYNSTLYYCLEAAARFSKEMLILDRPNPNGMFVDGPMLEVKQRSFVGVWPLPILHGLTLGELARAGVEEHWFDKADSARVVVVACGGYAHDSAYRLPVRPSPNLPNGQAIRLYASLCLFEGTIISVGRGTEYPFQVCGGLEPDYGTFTFIPHAMVGAQKPMYEGKTCYGLDLQQAQPGYGLDLSYLLTMYNRAGERTCFFNSFFNKLAGNEKLQRQVKRGASEAKIRKSWLQDLSDYKLLRKKYLLYPEENGLPAGAIPLD